MIGIADLPDFFRLKFAMLARLHIAQFTRIDKQDLVLARSLVLAQEPQADRNGDIVEQIRRHRNDAVHQMIFDDVFSNFCLSLDAGAH